MRYPKKIPENIRIKELVQHTDLVPSIFDLLDINILEDFDGKSLIPLISGNAKNFRSAILVEEAAHQRKLAIRTNDYKYIWSKSKEDATCKRCGRIHGGIEELYELNSDPEEKENIVAKEPEIAKKLKKKLFEWREYSETKRSKKEKRKIGEKINELKSIGKI